MAQLSTLVEEELLIRRDGPSRTASVTAAPDTKNRRLISEDFKPDDKLGLPVPVEMKEEFYAGRFRDGTGTARYTKYRRFQTSARILPQ